MFFLELTMQGVGPFYGTTNIGLREGLNLITGGNESGKTTIYNCFFSFFSVNFNTTRGLINRDNKEASRAALIFKSSNGETYRVVKDYLKAHTAVFKLNPLSKKFDSIEKDAGWFKGFLSSECGGLDTEEIKQVFGLQYAEALSIFPYGDIGSEAVTVNIVLTDDKKEKSKFNEKRLSDLREVLKRSDEVSMLELQMDEIQNKIHDLNERLDSLNSIEDRLAAVSAELDSLKDFADLPANIPELISAYETREKEKDVELKRIEEDLLIQDEELAGIPSRPLYKDKTFIIGTGLAILSSISLFLINLPAFFQPLSLAALIIGVSMFGYTIFKEAQTHTKQGEKEERIKTLKMNMRALVRKNEKENAALMEILKKTSTKDVSDLLRRYRNCRELMDIKKTLEKDRMHLLKTRDKAAMAEEQKSLQILKEELQGKLLGYAGMSTEIYGVKEEIERLEMELNSSVSNVQYEGAFGDVPIAERRDDGVSVLDMKKILKNDFIKLLPRIREEAQRIVGRLSSGRYDKLDIDEDSRILLSEKGKKEKISPYMLSSGEITQLYLSLRLAIFSLMSARAPFTLILDNTLLSFDLQRQKLALELLREMSKGRQIILLTSQNFSPSPEDHVVQF